MKEISAPALAAGNARTWPIRRLQALGIPDASIEQTFAIKLQADQRRPDNDQGGDYANSAITAI